MSDRPGTLYEFGPFRLDAEEGVLLRAGEPVPLTPKAFEMLLRLVERSGHLVGKEELLRQVWPEQFVEEGNLTQQIFALRRALGESPGGPRYIETVPRRGYRFVAEVRDGGRAGAPANPSPAARAAAEDGGARAKTIDSLAVLPLVNMSADPQVEYLSDGITESVINNLSQLTSLRVLARGTAFRYKGREVDPRETGRELKVGAVLTGRVLQFGDRLVVRAELVDADGWQLWGAQLDRDSSDIFAVQEEMAREIASSLRLKLSSREEQLLAKRHTESAGAFHSYLKGRYHWNRRTEDGLRKGIEHFQRAIAEDPVYALAYCGLADCYAVLGTFGGMEPKGAFPKAKAASLKALGIDDDLAEAHTSLAFVRQLYDWDWAGAEAGYGRAVALNPNCETARFWLATLLAATGRHDASIAEVERARELDPLSLPINTYVGWAFYFARRYGRAIEQYRKTLELDGGFIQARWRLGLAYTQAGMCAEAVAELEQGRGLAGDDPLLLSALGHAYAAAGRRGPALSLVARLQELSGRRYVAPYHLAVIYAGLGEPDLAFEWLGRAYEDRSGLLIYLKVDPIFDALRPDPRFADLLRRMGLDPPRARDAGQGRRGR